MKLGAFLAAIDWNSVGQSLITLGTRIKKSHATKIMKNRAVDSFGVGAGLVMIGYGMLQMSGLPQPIEDFIEAGKNFSKVTATMEEIKENTERTQDDVRELVRNFEKYKDRHHRQHRQLDRDMLSSRLGSD